MAHNHKEVVTMTDNELIERILQAQTGEQFLNLVNSENIIEKLHGGNTTIPDATVNELLLRILNIAKDKLSETQYDDFVKQKYMYGETILNLVAFHNPDETENILNYAKNKFTPQEYMAFVSQAFWYDKSTLHYAAENNPDYAKKIINTAKEKLSKAEFKAFFENDITKGHSFTLGETLLHIAAYNNKPELVDFVLDTARSVLSDEELAAFILQKNTRGNLAINSTYYIDINIAESILRCANKVMSSQQYDQLISTRLITSRPALLETILNRKQLTEIEVHTYCNHALEGAISCRTNPDMTKNQKIEMIKQTLTTAINAVKGLSIPTTAISSPPSIFEYLRVSLGEIDESLAENLAKHLTEDYQRGEELEFLLANQLKPGIALYISHSERSTPSLFSIRIKHSADPTTTYAEVLSETGELSLRDRIFCFFTGRFSLAFSVPSPAATKKGAHGGTTTKINPEGSPPPRPGANSGATPNPEEPTVRR